MLKNLLLVAIRNFKKDRWYSLINILGLTIGISFSLFLIFYIRDELSYDRYNVNAARIYRVDSYIKEGAKPEGPNAATQFILAPQLTSYPEVEQAVRLVPYGKQLYKNGSLSLYEDKVYYADSNLFRVFTYPFIEGDPQTALVAPNSMVLTASAAEKYFGKTEGVVGKTLRGDDGSIYKITGIAKDVPANSHLIFNLLISVSTFPKGYSNNWGGFGPYTYVLLKPNTDVAALERKLLSLYDKFMAPVFAPFNVKIRYGLQPITDIHLRSDPRMVNQAEQVGNMSYIYVFGVVALFMLLIACINYMNLTTARSARRAKEIGVRKVSGSSRWHLTVQFLVESVLTALAAMLISLVLIAILLPYFNSLSGKSISFSALMTPATVLTLTGIVLFVGLVGGSYPAFYLSRFNPVQVLKGSLASASGNATLRRILVVVQFSTAMTMLICTMVVYKQLQYVRNVDLGFNQQQVVWLDANTNHDVRSNIRAFVNDLRKDPRITDVSTSGSLPGQSTAFWLMSIQTKTGYTPEGVANYWIDEHYFKTLGMTIVKGRNFSGLGDTLHSIIVNQAMVKHYGWDQPIGKRVKWPGDTSGFAFEVVGVVKDFNQTSLYSAIAPLILHYGPVSNDIEVRLRANDVRATLADIGAAWKVNLGDLPFSYKFLDEDFDSQYSADQQREKIFTTFAILTVLITCLGLLGLIAFTTEQRQKEISIRKVMGARVGQIVPMITRNFVLLIGISCLIAVPAASLFMAPWLALFHYSTGLTVMPFIVAALAVLVITLLTVVFHTMRAAMANPVRGLRSE